MNDFRVGLRRVALEALLWAGPIAIALSIIVLVSNRSAFGHGPGVPSAGDPRAWSAIWFSMFLTGAGVLAGLLGNLVWLAMALRRRRPLRMGAWARAVVAAALATALLALWFNP